MHMRSSRRSQRNLRHPISRSRLVSRSRPVRGERGRRASRTTALVGVLLALISTFAATGAGPGSATGAPGDTRAVGEGADPIDFVVLVDQSKSLSDKDLSREVEAAALLSQGEISEQSRAAVIGFSSSEKNGQSEVREVCEPTVVDKRGREHLSDCVKELSRRDSRSMGPGTDFPAALRQALTRLKEGPSRHPQGDLPAHRRQARRTGQPAVRSRPDEPSEGGGRTADRGAGPGP